MKTTRSFALATFLFATVLATLPTNALIRKAGGTPVKYMTTSPAASDLSRSAILRAVIMAVDNFLWFSHA